MNLKDWSLFETLLFWMAGDFLSWWIFGLIDYNRRIDQHYPNKHRFILYFLILHQQLLAEKGTSLVGHNWRSWQMPFEIWEQLVFLLPLLRQNLAGLSFLGDKLEQNRYLQWSQAELSIRIPLNLPHILSCSRLYKAEHPNCFGFQQSYERPGCSF